MEFQRRGLARLPSIMLPPMPKLAPEFAGTLSGGGQKLMRISRNDWLLETLKEGKVRFAPAASYDDDALSAARADDEMAMGAHCGREGLLPSVRPESAPGANMNLGVFFSVRTPTYLCR